MRQSRTKAEIQAELEDAYRRIAELESAVVGSSAAPQCNQIEKAQRASEKRLRAMLEISQALSAPLELSAVLQKIVESAVDLLDLDSGAIYTLHGHKLFLEATTPPLPPEFPDELRHADMADHPHIQAAIAGGATVILPDTTTAMLSHAEREVAETRGLRSIAYVPLMISNRAIGVLIIASVHCVRVFGDEEIALDAGFAGQAAQTIEIARKVQAERRYAAALEAQIAERRQAEARLRESEKKYRDLINGMNDTVWVIDFDTSILDVNDTASRVLGYTRDELLAMKVSDIDAKIDANQIQQLADAIPGNRIQVFETQHTAKDGSIIPVEVSSSLVSYREKTAILSIARDITERKQTEEALREREDLLSVMGRTAHVGGWDFDAATGEGHWTEEVARIHDLDPATQPNKELGLSFYSGESKLRIAAAIQAAIDHAAPYDLELEIISAAGVHKWVRTIGHPVVENGRVVKLRGSFQDITDRKLAEAALREGEERFRTVADFTYELEYWRDEHGQLLYISPSCARLTGYSRDEFLHNAALLRTLIHPDDRLTYDRHLTEEILNAAPASFEFRIITADGRERWVSHTCQGVYTGDGKPHGRRVSLRDITEHHHAIEELRASEARYRLLSEELEARVQQRTAEVQDLYDNAPAGYHSLDANGRYVMINQTELSWLGYTRDEMIGRSALDFMTETSRNGFRKNFSLLTQHGWLQDVEFEFIRKDGSVLPVLLSATAIHDAAGNFVMSRSTLFDITERKKAEATLRQANAALASAMRMKDEFLATMSHELRTPLTGILGLAESLQLGIYGELTIRQMKAATSIETSGHHLLELINDVLDLSKIEADKLELQLERYALEEICQASLHLTKGLAQQRRQHVHYAAPLDPVFLEVDARRIKQVLINLLSNAIKFTPENGELGLIVEGSAAKRQVRLIVWDKGIGIKSENLSKLFQPFTQIDSSLAREYSGTGLGLALVRRLVELHNGSVMVESVFGEGSRFIVTLPWTPQMAQSGAPETENETSRMETIDENQSSPLILITDDNQIMLELLTDFLEVQGYHTAKVQSGKELLAKLEHVTPDVILMDIQMPGMDGLETISRIRNHHNATTAAVKIIAVTALVMPGDRERCMKAGANEYMSKPLDLKKLVAVIQNLTPGTRGHKQAIDCQVNKL